MTHINANIESAPIASIKSLKSRFEQLALDNASSSSKPTPISPAPTLPQCQTVVAPKSTSASCSRVQPDDYIPQSQPAAPVCNVRNGVSASDMKAAALKRAPPPPPPPRTKKSSSSPVASPLLRPVPPPNTLRTPSASPECEPLSVRPDLNSNGIEESSEDGLLGGVALFRNKFS
ncbi:hypothetical protein V8E55_002501 [Tylopilus felleus]